MTIHWERDEAAYPGSMAASPWDPTPVSVIGLSHTGAVTAACLASLGHNVVVTDLQIEPIAAMANGRAPVREAELGALIAVAVEDGMLTAKAEIARAVSTTQVSIVTLGEEDSPGIIGRRIACGLTEKPAGSFHVVVMTGPNAQSEALAMARVIEKGSGLTVGVHFGVASHAEPLRRGAAVADFFRPRRLGIGVTDKRSARIVTALLAPSGAMAQLTNLSATTDPADEGLGVAVCGFAHRAMAHALVEAV